MYFNIHDNDETLLVEKKYTIKINKKFTNYINCNNAELRIALIFKLFFSNSSKDLYLIENVVTFVVLDRLPLLSAINNQQDMVGYYISRETITCPEGILPL